jgi:flavin-dependent dehydrogenase
MPQDFDAIIVGARAAGAATAMLLVRAGARVLVVERDAPGTDTLSTHALMRGGVMQLARWGLVPALEAAGTPPVRSTIFAYEGERIEVAIKPGDGVGHLLAPRRTVLDPALVAAAAAAGAVIRHRTALTGLVRDAGGAVRGARLAGPDGETEVTARIVVGADGRRSSLARMVGAAEEVTGRHAAAVIYAHVRGLPNLGYRWLYGRGVAAGAIPTNDDAHVVFASLPPGRYAAVRGALAPALAATIAAIDPGLAAEIAARGLASRPVGFSGAPGFLRRSHGPGWALVGDAGYFKDPITAHGITDALRDAGLLADAILEDAPSALAHYQETRDALSGDLFRITDEIASLPTDLGRLKDLHRAFSAAMKAEQRWLAARASATARAA